MKLINQTNKTTLAEHVIEAKSLKDQTVGLLKYKTPTALLIKTNFGIHTFFMKYAIDVIVLDKYNRVTELKENLKPNRFFFWNPIHETIIELPNGTLTKTKTKRKDIVEIK